MHHTPFKSTSSSCKECLAFWHVSAILLKPFLAFPFFKPFNSCPSFAEDAAIQKRLAGVVEILPSVVISRQNALGDGESCPLKAEPRGTPLNKHFALLAKSEAAPLAGRRRSREGAEVRSRGLPRAARRPQCSGAGGGARGRERGPGDALAGTVSLCKHWSRSLLCRQLQLSPPPRRHPSARTCRDPKFTYSFSRPRWSGVEPGQPLAQQSPAGAGRRAVWSPQLSSPSSPASASIPLARGPAFSPPWGTRRPARPQPQVRLLLLQQQTFRAQTAVTFLAGLPP